MIQEANRRNILRSLISKNMLRSVKSKNMLKSVRSKNMLRSVRSKTNASMIYDENFQPLILNITKSNIFEDSSDELTKNSAALSLGSAGQVM
jgi:hypothetical protein